MTSDDLRSHLQAIYDEHGHLTPDLVVDAARPKDSPLHAAVFDRPKAQAAEAWYRMRAHELIRKVRVTYVTNDVERDVRAFHAVRVGDGIVYEPAEKVAQDPFIRAMVLRDMERDWHALKARYGDFAEFAELVQFELRLAS